jgi:predicted enzyme related to lactoylglutathione lyase
MAKSKAKAKKPAPKKPAKKVPAKKPAAKKAAATPPGDVLRSIRSVIYQVDDLAKAKEFYSAALGREPYFDEPFYVGYLIDGQELGLDPDLSAVRPGPGGAVAYWQVGEITASWQRFTALGGQSIALPHTVGGNIEVAIVADPFGNLVGLIQMP